MTPSEYISFTRPEQFTLTIAEQLLCIRENKHFVDFKILIQDDMLPCHSLVLALHSPYMKAMLLSGMTETSKREVRLDHISLDIINIILDYMYSGKLTFHKKQLMSIISATDYLQMKELKEMCVAEVPSVLEPANVFSWWHESDLQGLQSIKELCTDIMISDFSKISALPEFLSLSYSELKEYINDICKNNLQHDDVIAAVTRWTVYDKSRSSNYNDFSHMQEHEKPKEFSLCIVAGDVSLRDVNRQSWKVNKSNEMEKLCDVLYDGFKPQHSICKTPTGFIITGGSNSNVCMQYTTTTKSWRRLRDMLTQRKHHASICVGDKLYVFGGCRCMGELAKSVHILPLHSNIWQKGPNLPIAMAFSKVAEICNNIYLLHEISQQLLYLDKDRKAWSSRASFPWIAHDIYGVSMISAHGRLYVAGGRGNIFCVVQTGHRHMVRDSTTALSAFIRIPCVLQQQAPDAWREFR